MSQFGDFFARIVSTGGSRGLSGDSELVLPSSSSVAYYNDRLRRHRTSDDLIAEPERIWDASGLFARRTGLSGHLRAERGDGVLGISDVLVVINRDDWRRSFGEVRRPWVQRVQTLLQERFDRFCQDEDFHALFPQRPVGFTIVEDGSEALSGLDLRLDRGEFVTGLLPNHYAGPAAGSAPVVSVHVHIPGAWEGYREVGRLWSDQVLFTLGAHPLDNFAHDALQEPALYRLHRYGDGSFVHVVNPELRDAYHISNQETPGGASVLTLEDASGTAVAFIVLAIEGSEDDSVSIAPASTAPPPAGDAGPATAEAAADLPAERSYPLLGEGSRTVVPLELDERILTLREQGALLQKVHFSRFMEGYDVYIGSSGEVATAMPAPAATLHVRGREISIAAHSEGVTVGDAPLAPGEPRFLNSSTTLSVNGNAIEFIDLSRVREDGWPYLAELRRPGGSAHMVFGSRYQVGRDPRSKVRLPDEPHNDNIVWRPELRAGGSIRSRNGEIPKSRFYIDSIMVASQHAEIDLVDAPRVLSRARHCYTYVRRDGDLFPLYPTREGGGPMEMVLEEGDELIVGNCVFDVSFVEPEHHPANSIAPEAVQTVGPAGAPADDALAAEGADAPPAGPGASLDPFDVPAAAGLGERGRKPRSIDAPSLRAGAGPADSILGIEAPEPRLVTEESPRVAPPMLTHTLSDFESVTANVSPVDETSVPSPRNQPLAIEIGPTPEIAGAPAAGVEPDGGSPADLPESPLAARRPTAPTPAPPADPEVDPDEDPTGLPTRPPPPVALPTSGDSILGVIYPPDAPTHLGQPGADDDAEADAPRRTAADADADAVVCVDEADWQLEVSRPGSLTQTGWMVTGRKRVGNHSEADIVVPENRAVAGQRFAVADYVEVYCRGRRAQISTLDGGDVRLYEGDAAVSEVQDVDAARIELIRRDSDGVEDFAVGLSLERSDDLPDPRARLLRIDLEDRMVQALFTTGLPLRQTRTVRLGRLTCRAHYDGDQLEISDYIDSYHRSDGSFHPFFVSGRDGSFRTLPEDGTPVVLLRGDRLIADGAVFRFDG